MPFDLTAIGDALQRGFGQVPPIAIALVLLAGPTTALIGYRLIRVARRMQAAPEVEAAPLWVCHDCRSVNEFRMSRCYRCGVERAAGGDVEVFVDRPAVRPTTFEVPAGSPFAALGATPDQRTEHGQGPGIPVMADAAEASDAVAVGPGRSVESDVESSGELAPAVERRP
jgi:hypothetical protein